MDINIVLIAAIIVGSIALISAIILYFISKAFKVIEDPRIDEVTKLLPGINCGGCGFASCRNFGEAVIKAETLEGFVCLPGGNAVNEKIAVFLGLQVAKVEPKIAVVRCNGSRENAPAKFHYDSILTCRFAVSLFAGESACSFGCMGYGDCVAACKFDAMHINKITQLPEVDEVNCIECGDCVNACPRQLIEMRNKETEGHRVFVACRNKEKGAAAKKNCTVACTGCGKCVKVCAFDAITIQDNLAYIDYSKCRLCRKCVNECPTHAIHECNFPLLKENETVPQVEYATLNN